MQTQIHSFAPNAVGRVVSSIERHKKPNQRLIIAVTADQVERTLSLLSNLEVVQVEDIDSLVDRLREEAEGIILVTSDSPAFDLANALRERVKALSGGESKLNICNISVHSNRMLTSN